MGKRIWIAAGLLVLAGCSVRVSKNTDGEDKDVHVSVPFAHVDVQKHAGASLGLPVYPGASLESSENDKSVDVSLGFGAWKLRVQAAQYVSPDPASKVQAFYKQALAQYGDVLTCRGHEPVGEPTRTTDGLTCRNDDKSGRGKVSSGGDLELKAGTRRRQHIVGFDEKKGPGTHFALVSLALPRENAGAAHEN